MFKVMLVVAILGTCAFAGQIDPSGFVSPVVDTYEGLGLPFDNAAPIVINGNTYGTDDGTLRYAGFSVCFSGSCIGNNTDTGYIDIVLGTPTLRAGGYVSLGSNGNVTFFDQSDALLGTVPIDTDAATFAGWQADSGLIARMRITENNLNSQIVVFDNLTVEGGGSGVPEPGSFVLAAATLAIMLAGRRFYAFPVQSK
jgi:hypothetical protein